MGLDLDQISDRLADVDARANKALEAVQSDSESSPALKAVLGEFRKKSLAAIANLDEAEEPIREYIVQLEQAGDSARSAAQAESRIQDSTRQLVLEAHQVISTLKAETKE